MNRTLYLAIALITLFPTIFAVSLNIERVAGVGTIYIRSDGTTDPKTASIVSTDNVTYRLTSNVSDSIVVERSNILIDGNGYVLQGDGLELDNNGITLQNVSNVTIRNTYVTKFGCGIWLRNSSYNAILGCWIINDDSGGIVLNYASNNLLSENRIENNGVGLYIGPSSNCNNITGNSIIANAGFGLCIRHSANNSITQNSVAASQYGLTLEDSVNSTIVGNNIAYCDLGLNICSENRLWHNDLMYNTQQAIGSLATVWDNSYPSGGNYWSDYAGEDVYHGKYQNETGSDGIGDWAYDVDTNGVDNYPLMQPWLPPDISVLNLTGSKTMIGIGYVCNVTAHFENKGNKVENFEVGIFGNGSLLTYQSFLLRSHDSMIYVFAWNTSGFVVGNYTLFASVTTLPEENDRANNDFDGGWILVTVVGDLNGDKFVDAKDAVILGVSFDSTTADPYWNTNADINSDNNIDSKDVAILKERFG